MNQCVTPATPDDFLALLDDTLRRRNERMRGKVLAWAELLDAAGWRVALNWAGGDFWLSGRAKRDLQRLGGVPETWKELLAALAGVAPESIHRKSEGVILWSGQPPAKKSPGPAADLTRRETEVMTWLREGKSSQEIAIIFGCSIRTVEKHLANLYRKIGVRNRAAVILNPSNS